jgi:hypothetical protein
MPNLTGVIASPRLTCGLRALNASTSRQRASNLAVVRGVAGAVEVAGADDVRRQIECPRHAIDDLLDHQHALRAAEAAERGVRHVMRAADAADHFEIGHVIAVVGVEHGPAEHREAEVERPAAIAEQLHGERPQPAGPVEAGLEAGQERVALAGQHHVLAPRQADADRALQARRRQRRDRRPPVGLHFLAAERPAHPQALHHHRVLGHGEDAGHDLLCLGRVLRRRVDQHAAVLVAIRQRGVGLEVEVLLPADGELARDPVRRAAQRGRRVSLGQPIASREEAVGGDGLLDRQDRRQHLAVDADEAGRQPRLLLGLGDHPRDGVSGKADLGRKQRLVAPGDADVVLAGHVVAGQHGEDARRLARRGSVDTQDARVRVRHLHRPGVRDVRHVGPQVVDVARRAGHVADRRFVRQARPDGRGGRASGGDRADRLVHCPASTSTAMFAVSATHFSSSRPIMARR